MGIAAGLFYTTDDTENCLDWRIRPSDEQYDLQQKRWNDLRDHLIADLASRSGCGIASWLQGSYKFGTQIRPASPSDEFDIDLGMYFQWAGEPSDGEYRPTEIKQFVQDSLLEYADDDDNDADGVEEPRAKCSRVHFAGNFHIDVPAYHLDSSRDTRALATDKDQWETSDPKAIYQWWKDATGQTDRARCRRLVRYLKMWAALKFAEDSRPSSILLTVLAAQAFISLDRDKYSGDDEFLRAVLSEVVDRLRGSYQVVNPANAEENLNRLSSDANDALLLEFEAFLAIADRALAASTKTASAEVWSEAFDQFFPVPEEDDAEEAALKIHESRALATLKFDPIVNVVATTGARAFTGTNRIGPIPKGCDIRFTLSNAVALPKGATVDWMVRNSGAEAESVNDLGHRVGRGLSVSRDSAYRGNHYMDVAVKLNGLLIGSRRIPVEISSLGMPKRNSSRPSWVALRKRR